MHRLIIIILLISIISCEAEKVDDNPTDVPLALCIDGHAKFTSNGVSYEFECDGYDLMSYISLNEMDADSGNDCWGWTDSQSGREYALMGLDNGTAIVDISIPTAPKYLGKIPTSTQSSSWRDLKVYNDHVFIVSEASDHGMQVFDLRRLRGISNKQIFNPDYVYQGYGQAHNIAINTETGYAYTAGSGLDINGRPGFGIHALNISNPLLPLLETQFSDYGYTHDAQIIIYKGPDTEHIGKEIYIGSNENKVVFVDVTDKSNPNLISEFFYDDEYTHQSWLTEDHRYALLGDELDELDTTTQPWKLKSDAKTRTIVVDITDLDNPILHFNYFGNTKSIDHNGYIVGNNYFLASYTSGLRVINIKNIDDKNFNEIGFFDTHTDTHNHNLVRKTSSRNSDPGDHTGKKGQEIDGFNGAWSVYPFFKSENIIISDINSGLFIVRKSFD